MGEWQVAQRPSPLKYASPALASPTRTSPALERRRAAQRVVDALPDEMREIGDLRVGEAAARRARLHRMPLLQERSDRVAIAIAQHDLRPDQVGAPLGAARAGAVAGDAFRRVDLAAPVGGRRIDAVTIGRADVRPWSRRNRRLLAAPAAGACAERADAANPTVMNTSTAPSADLHASRMQMSPVLPWGLKTPGPQIPVVRTQGHIANDGRS